MADESKAKDSASKDAVAAAGKDPLAPAGPAASPTPAAPASPPAATQATADAARIARLEQIALQGRPLGATMPTPGLDVTIPGGKYRVGDQWLNADGEEIDEQGNLLHPERARRDQFGRMTTIR